MMIKKPISRTFYKGQELFNGDFIKTPIDLKKDQKLLNRMLFEMIYFKLKLKCPSDITIQSINRLCQIKFPEYDLNKTVENKVTYIYKKYNNDILIEYITKTDIEQILRYGNGSLPKIKFLYQLIKFMNPRIYQNMYDKLFPNGVSISVKLLIRWSSNFYIKFIKYFENVGIIERSKMYIPWYIAKDKRGVSKKIRLKNWKIGNRSDIIYSLDQYSPITFKDAILIMYPVKKDFINILKSLDYNTKQVYKIKEYVYNNTKNIQV